MLRKKPKKLYFNIPMNRSSAFSDDRCNCGCSELSFFLSQQLNNAITVRDNGTTDSEVSHRGSGTFYEYMVTSVTPVKVDVVHQ